MEGHRIQIFGDRTDPAHAEFNVIKERQDLVEMGSHWLDMAAWHERRSCSTDSAGGKTWGEIGSLKICKGIRIWAGVVAI